MKWLFKAAVLLSPLALLPTEPEAELLSLQRIADFWNDGELGIAKAQMIDFLENFPQSPHREMICTAVGDLFLREGDFSSALNWYSKIEYPSSEILLKRFRCLYQLGWYATLIDEISFHQEKNKDSAPELNQLLALSLYQQCLNDPNKQHELALRAKPLFIELLAKNENEETAHALAHIYTLLEDLEGAASIYETLAKSHPEHGYLLQAALIESKIDLEKAIHRLDQVLDEGREQVADAAYWWLAFSAKQGHHQEVIDRAETLLLLIDPKLQGSASIFVGESYRALKQNEKAAKFFQRGLATGGEGEFRRTAMLALAEASYLEEDLPLLEKTIDQLKTENPADPTLPVWMISKARVLEKLGRLEEALSTVAAVHEDIAQMEKIRLEIKAGQLQEARKSALLVAAKDSKQGYRLLLQASEALSKESAEGKAQFLKDLASALEKAAPSLEEEKSWKLLGAITAYELENLDQAIAWISPLATSDFPDAELMLALCYQNSSDFIPLAEKALKDGATLISPRLQHLSLFNVYRESQPEKAAEHLFNALGEKSIQEENLLWLSHFASSHFPAEKREQINRFLCEGKRLEPKLEKPMIEWAKANAELGKNEEAIAQYEQLCNSYNTEDTLSWNHHSECFWQLAKLLQAKGLQDRAEELFTQNTQTTCSRRDYFIAAAALDLARMKNDLLQSAPLLRDLVLQKYLPNEPLHLEAALETVELLGTDPEKKISLLTKMKNEFTEEEDILAKEYHAARKASVEQNHIYQSYLQFIEAKLLLLNQDQELQAKGKDLLIHLLDTAPPEPLRLRIEPLLNRSDAHDLSTG